MISYQKVIPRDFFNEAKLLKCLGQLSLLLHNRELVEDADEGLSDHEFFQVRLREDGFLYCANYSFYVADVEIDLYIPYNSMDSYPLLFEDSSCRINSVFKDDGSLSEYFMLHMKYLSQHH